jgi:hypothetical protein
MQCQVIGNSSRYTQAIETARHQSFLQEIVIQCIERIKHIRALSVTLGVMK